MAATAELDALVLDILDRDGRDIPRDSIDRMIANATRHEKFPDAMKPDYRDEFVRDAFAFRRLRKKGWLKVHGRGVNDFSEDPNQVNLQFVHSSQAHLRLVMHPYPLTWLGSTFEPFQGLKHDGEVQVISAIVGTVKQVEMMNANARAARRQAI